MLKIADCRALAEHRLNLIAAQCETDLVMLERTFELGVTVAFFYQSEEYARTGNSMAALAGNAPILVNMVSGAVDVAGTGMPIEEYINEFEART